MKPPTEGFYIHFNGEQSGPIPFLEVKKMWEKGAVPSEALCWHSEWGEWRDLSLVMGSHAADALFREAQLEALAQKRQARIVAETGIDGKIVKDLYKSHIKANLNQPISRDELTKRTFADARKVYPYATDGELKDAFVAYTESQAPSLDVRQSQAGDALAEARRNLARALAVSRRHP